LQLMLYDDFHISVIPRSEVAPALLHAIYVLLVLVFTIILQHLLIHRCTGRTLRELDYFQVCIGHFQTQVKYMHSVLVTDMII